MARTDLVEQFKEEVHELTAALIESGLVDDQNFVNRRTVGNKREGTQTVALEAAYWSDPDVRVLASIPYHELHAHLTTSRAYDLRFLDGALAQFRFEFSADSPGILRRSRIAFLPAPDLTPFQQDPEIYLHDEVFGNVVDQRAVTTPFRFDYDIREGTVVDGHHPAAHVTLGQYPHCRIAAAGPITPYYFVEFVARAFYRTKTISLTDQLPSPRVAVPATITSHELTLVHIGLPTGAH
ncbi:MAG: DUF2290 domain-containing protein [Bacillota bacterium]|nr:DUF2290 domain-containing protein [Bacillota bacterium]